MLPPGFPEDPVPLRLDEGGAIRVGQTRVLLEMVIYCYRAGYTPEAVVESFTSLSLPDVYDVFAYYMRHPEPVDAYLAEVERIGAENEKLAVDYMTSELRKRVQRKWQERHAEAPR